VFQKQDFGKKYYDFRRWAWTFLLMLTITSIIFLIMEPIIWTAIKPTIKNII